MLLLVVLKQTKNAVSKKYLFFPRLPVLLDVLRVVVQVG
jgi:hypothetical protein